DLRLPDLDGVEVCARLRQVGCWSPILMLTARDGVDDRVRGLDVGADDYLTKPFAFPELFARVRALVRRGIVERPSELVSAALFVYAKVRDDLRSSVDMGLRSRAQVIVGNASRPDARIGGGPARHHLIDADEAFAQVLTTGGSVAEATPAVRRVPLVPATVLATVRRARFVDAPPPGLHPAPR